MTWECPFCFGEDGAHRERCSLAHRKTPPAAPVVHMNGTGFDDLYLQYDRANDALRDALDALKRAGPNGRDYYVQSAGEMERAQDEHFDRMRRLEAVRAEVEFILCKVSDQDPRRAR